MVLRDALEHERVRLAGAEREGGVDAVPAPLERPVVAHGAGDRALERERQVGRAEQHPVRVHLDLVLGAPVVEARLHLDAEVHRPAHDHDAAHEPVAVLRDVRVVDRHEVLHLADPALGEEARDEDVRVGEVELLRVPVVGVGAQRVEAALLLVEDRPEHARGVERGAAVPVDRPVGADERDRVEVADQPVLGDRQVVRLELPGVGHAFPISALPARRPSPRPAPRPGRRGARAGSSCGARGRAPSTPPRPASRARAAGRRRPTRRRR